MRLFGNPHAERMGRLRLLEVNELRMLSNSDDVDKFDIVSSVEVESHRHRSPTWDGYGLRECVVCVRNRERARHVLVAIKKMRKVSISFLIPHSI